MRTTLKIIVGLGLVNLKQAPELMNRLASAISECLPSDATTVDALVSTGGTCAAAASRSSCTSPPAWACR